MSLSPVTIRYEQAVYGSFPFRHTGYAILAQSPGCRPEWIAGLRAACQRFGDRPGGVSAVGGLFALRMASGPWMIVGVGSPGSDDRGRPGALAFHALFVSPRDYRRAGCDPFALSKALRNDWTEATDHLPAGTLPVGFSSPPIAPLDPRAPKVVAALTRGRRVAIEATAPIDALARQVWPALPDRVRRRATLATWAFGNGNRFDLVALPRLAGVGRDASYVDPSALEGGEEAPASARSWHGPRSLVLAGATAILAVVLLGLRWHRGDAPALAGPDTSASAPSLATPVPPDRPPPDRAAYPREAVDPDERRRVAEALLALAERFGVPVNPAVDDPAALMIVLADRLRYRGPTLTPAELSDLSAAPGRDGALALRWHDRVRRFADDRRLPDGFARGPLRWQLDTLAWSFHLDRADDPDAGRRSSAEVPHALGEALAVDIPVRPTGLSARYPALSAYRDFLGPLPRR